MKVTFQPMRVEHLDAIQVIEKQSFPIPWPRQTFEFEILHNELAHYIVAVCEGQVVGYGGFWMILNDGHITNIAVLPSFRGCDIGKALLFSLMSNAYALGADRMTLEVRPSNVVARALYESFGFVEAGCRKGYYQDNNEDAIIMWNYYLARWVGKPQA